jgi:hypothetical protein
MTPTQEKIYNEAKLSLGEHLTLNPNVPADVGCAEAVSFVLKNAGITGIPAQGYAGTADLYQWLLANPQFKLIEQPEQGAIIVSATGFGNGTVEGHCGVLGAFGAQYPNEFGILSNNSDNGLFQEKWNLLTWWENYGLKGHLPVALFRAV